MKRYLICMLIMLSLLSGCTAKEEVSSTLDDNETLIRVEYSKTSGMTRGDDFFIDVTPEIINSALIFAERDLEYLSVEDSAVSDAQWKDINDAVLAIEPVLKEIQPAPEKEKSSNNPFGQPLDGLDSSSFYLTWQTSEGEVRTPYEIPSDRRFFTLLEILRETADPIGREIVYYEAPVLTGVHLRRESLLPFERYSYQCTVINEGTDEHYFVAYYYDGGSTSFRNTVYESTWNQIEKKCAELGIEELESSSSSNKTSCTLYYSDQTQRTVVLDKQTQQELRVLFEQIVSDLKEES